MLVVLDIYANGQKLSIEDISKIISEKLLNSKTEIKGKEVEITRVLIEEWRI